MTQISIVTAGIDTSKHKLDVAIPAQAKLWQVENTQAGWQNLARQLMQAGVGRIGIEPSGGYQRAVVTQLRAAGFEVLLLQPMQVRAFAKVHRRRAKNDTLDAVLIAECAATMPPPRVKSDPRLEDLALEMTFLEQTEEDLNRLKVRLEHATARQCAIITADIKLLKKRRNAEIARIRAALQAYPDLAKRFALVCSIPGIGERTALAIVVRMPELGQLTREEAAALAGLAPFDDDSGQRHGHRHIAGGRARLRRSLYAAALAASSRWNAALVVLYRRLKAAGKPHKAALVACARKLIIYANTVVQRGTPWTDQPTTATTK